MKLRVMKQKEQLESRSFCFINIEKLRLRRNRLLRIHIYWSEPAETIRLEAVGDSEELIGKLPVNLIGPPRSSLVYSWRVWSESLRLWVNHPNGGLPSHPILRKYLKSQDLTLLYCPFEQRGSYLGTNSGGTRHA